MLFFYLSCTGIEILLEVFYIEFEYCGVFDEEVAVGDGGEGGVGANSDAK